MMANTQPTSPFLFSLSCPCSILFKSHEYLMQASHNLLFIMLEDKSIVEMQCSESLTDISVSFFQNILPSFGLK